MKLSVSVLKKYIRFSYYIKYALSGGNIMAEKSNIFRKKSMDRISSPEKLNDYIRVSTPGIWLLLAAIVILLAGIGVWAAFGTIESSIPVCAISDGNETWCYIREEDRESVTEDMVVEIEGKRSLIGEITALPEAVDSDFPEYALHVGNLKAGEWVYSAKLFITLPEGIYEAKLITEQVSPLSFVFG